MLKFGSVCSGIEAASLAWGPLGWRSQFFSEIDKFPSAVLAHHYPDTPNLGDMTRFKDWPDANLDVLAGGTPCQSFSNAGLRAGLDDPRGQLMLTYGAIAARYRPKWLVWENVPGVLSSNEGRDFGAFLGLLGFLGYGFAYRVLDAQFVRVDGYGRAVPQRRERVFVVGCLGDWRSAAAVLLERESLRGDSAPRREAGARTAACLTRGAESSGKGGYAGRRQEDDVNIVTGMDFQNCAGTGDLCGTLMGEAQRKGGQAGHGVIIPGTALCLNAKGGGGRLDGESETLIPTNGGRFVGALPFDTTQITSAANRSNPKPGDPCHPLVAGGHAPAIAFDARQSDVLQYGQGTGPLDTDGHTMGILQHAAVRRLTPVECERLQGMPDNYTRIAWRGKPAEACPDGPRYKAIGNSWAVNCPRWIGRRINLVEQIHAARQEAA